MKQKSSSGAAMWATLLAACVSLPALAETNTPSQDVLDSKVVVDLGAFVLSTSVGGRLNGSSTINPDVDFDSAFGRGGDATRVRADALWRITPRQHVRVLLFDNQRSVSRVIDKPISWGDYTFKVGGNVAAQTRFSIAELAYEYAFKREADYELAASAGIHYTQMKVGISGAATVTGSNGQVVQVPAAATSNSVPAPLPVLGLRGGWAASPHWYLDAQVQYFKMSIDNISGYVSDWRTSATWMYSSHLGLGLGYNRFVTNVDVSRKSFDGRLRLGYSGLQVFLTGAF